VNQRPEAFADALVPDSYPEIHPRAGRPETREESATAGSGTGTVVFLHGGNVANWMWESQVRALPDFQVLTPNLPGFGTRTDEQWDSLEATADDVAAFVAEHAEAGPVHLVGLSLGAVVALQVVARHPELASSLLVSGAVVSRVGGLPRALSALQLAGWEREWFWRAQARAFRLPADSVELYVRHGLSVQRGNAQRMLAQVYAGSLPAGLGRYGGRVLAVAGQKEPGVVAKSFAVLRGQLPAAHLRLAPGMHHVWNVEDESLFNAMVRQWVSGSVHPGLINPA
jgi:pimeloyl-ACP methyl ester carboxylesterase